MNNSEIDLGAVSAALKAVKHLRCSVNDLFKCLEGSDGDSREENNDAWEKQFFDNVKTLIDSTNLRIGELESSCSMISPSSGHLDLANTTHLAQDPSYSSLIACYRYTDKLCEFSNHAYMHLNQNLLRRSMQGRSFVNTNTSNNRIFFQYLCT